MFPKGENPQIKRVEFELRSTGINPDAANPLRSGIHSRGYLPHVKRDGSRYFTTFRFADSLPRAVLIKYQAERAERIRRLQALESSRNCGGAIDSAGDTIEEIEREFRRNIERFLDKGCGQCWLRRPEFAALVAGALKFFDGDRYRLDAWVVMPNHVHAVLGPVPNQTLSAIVQSWKRFTGRQANKLLNRTGQPFWQPEAYDHWIRNDEEHARCCRYIVNNPVKARLCEMPEDWLWSSAWRGAQSS